jgi:hypothetical protein
MVGSVAAGGVGVTGSGSGGTIGSGYVLDVEAISGDAGVMGGMLVVASRVVYVGGLDVGSDAGALGEGGVGPMNGGGGVADEVGEIGRLARDPMRRASAGFFVVAAFGGAGSTSFHIWVNMGGEGDRDRGEVAERDMAEEEGEEEAEEREEPDERASTGGGSEVERGSIAWIGSEFLELELETVTGPETERGRDGGWGGVRVGAGGALIMTLVGVVEKRGFS